MAGYQRKAKLYTLKWAEGQELHGLEVTVKGLSVEHMLELTALAAAIGTAKDVAAKAEQAGKLFRRFAARLVMWNMEDENGDPVPATYEGVASCDLDMVIELVTTWIGAVTSVDNPLPKPSSNGGTTDSIPPMLASLPMAPLSPNPSN